MCNMSAVNRFVFYRCLSTIPCGKEHIRQSWHWPHWNLTTPRISRSRPHCLCLWLDGSIIIPSACHRRLCSAMQSPSPEGWCVRLCGLPIRAAEGKYLMCCIFACQRTTENFEFCSLTTKGKNQHFDTPTVTNNFDIHKISALYTKTDRIICRFYLF